MVRADRSPEVFVSYNSRDAEAVTQVAAALEAEGFTCWLDRWTLIAGDDFSDEIEDGLESVASIVVVIGEPGLGPWHRREIAQALERRRREPAFRVIPLFLPGTSVGDKPLPPSLLAKHVVSVTKGAWPDAMERLVAGLRKARGAAPASRAREAGRAAHAPKAGGSRNVTIDGGVSGSVIITGDGNSVDTSVRSRRRRPSGEDE